MQDNAHEKVAVLIAGPTASGKSALALAVAERIGGIVVNTDSMQVYGDLAIITARPGGAELLRVPNVASRSLPVAAGYISRRSPPDSQQSRPCRRKFEPRCAQGSKRWGRSRSMQNSRAAIPLWRRGCV